MEILKTFVFVEEARFEKGHPVRPALLKVAVAAIVANPFASKDQDDLSLLVAESKDVGQEIAAKAIAQLGTSKPQSYGKAALVGLDGEQEHGVAMLTNVFGNIMRDAAGGGKAWISSMTKLAAPGASIDIPLAHKDALYVRSHYDGMTITLPGAPLPGEIAVICAFATGARPRARVGGLGADKVKGEDGLT